MFEAGAAIQPTIEAISSSRLGIAATALTPATSNALSPIAPPRISSFGLPFEYASTTLTLHPGERIALFTDGLFESAPSEAQRKHLEEQIRFSLHDTLRLPIEQAIEQVMTIFDQIAGTPPNDDTLLLLLEPIEKEEGNGEPTGPAG